MFVVKIVCPFTYQFGLSSILKNVSTELKKFFVYFDTIDGCQSILFATADFSLGFSNFGNVSLIVYVLTI